MRTAGSAGHAFADAKWERECSCVCVQWVATTLRHYQLELRLKGDTLSQAQAGRANAPHRNATPEECRAEPSARNSIPEQSIRLRRHRRTHACIGSTLANCVLNAMRCDAMQGEKLQQSIDTLTRRSALIGETMRRLRALPAKCAG